MQIKRIKLFQNFKFKAYYCAYVKDFVLVLICWIVAFHGNVLIMFMGIIV